MMNNLSTKGSVFVGGQDSVGHARKVWREVREVLPCGGVIKNPELFEKQGLIPSGTPVSFNDVSKEVTLIGADKLKSGDLSALNICGYTQECIPYVKGAVHTCTIVVDGDLYAPMFDQSVVDKLKKLPSVNGLKIRFVV